MVDIPRRLFPLGQVVATPGALEALRIANQSHNEFLDKHVTGDWGECCDDDKRANELALEEETRIFSVYRTARGEKIWIITEADRSSTCILLPDEY